jgi:hypothetical protein
MQIAGIVADWLGKRVTPAEAKESDHRALNGPPCDHDLIIGARI